MKIEKALFGAGCFWHVQAEFDKLNGVKKTTCGYAGGQTENPTYKEVCTDKTGHAEVVQVEFDPKSIPYEKILEAFFDMHDPTTINRQGPDVGTQYRSVIFYFDTGQKKAAEKAMKELVKSNRLQKPVVTKIEKAGKFFPAEEYHQKYYEKNGLVSCRI